MPAIGGITATPTNILMAPANIWLGVTAPTTGTRLALSSGTPSTGTNIGATMGPATFAYRPTITEIMVEQATAPVDFGVNVEEASIQFNVSELTAVNLQMNLLSVARKGPATGGSQWVHGGGITNPANTTVVLIAPRRDNAGGTMYSVVMLYKAFLPEGVDIPFTKSTPTGMTVRLKAMADTTRPVNDHMFQFIPNHDGTGGL